MRNVLQHPRVQRHLAQGWRFGVVGATGAVVDLGVLRYLVSFAGWGPISARVISMSLSLTIVFFCNRSFTFKSSTERSFSAQLLRFALAYASGIIFNFALYSGFIWLGVPYWWAGVLSIGIGAVWNYALSHRFVFAVSRH